MKKFKITFENETTRKTVFVKVSREDARDDSLRREAIEEAYYKLARKYGFKYVDRLSLGIRITEMRCGR